MKIRVVTTFIIAQAALAKEHASRRSANITVADQAVQCNQNMDTKFVQQIPLEIVMDNVAGQTPSLQARLPMHISSFRMC